MFKLGAAFLALAVPTSMGLAQTSPSLVVMPEVIGPRGAGGGHRAADHQAQQAARVSLVQAIGAAEVKGSGRAIWASFEADTTGGHYEIKVLGDDGKLVEHHVDAVFGQVTTSESRSVESFLTRLKAANIRKSSTTLQQAIDIAERKAGGRAAEAAVERDGDAVRYIITVVQGDRSQDVQVAPEK